MKQVAKFLSLILNWRACVFTPFLCPLLLSHRSTKPSNTTINVLCPHRGTVIINFCAFTYHNYRTVNILASIFWNCKCGCPYLNWWCHNIWFDDVIILDWRSTDTDINGLNSLCFCAPHSYHTVQQNCVKLQQGQTGVNESSSQGSLTMTGVRTSIHLYQTTIPR